MVGWTGFGNSAVLFIGEVVLISSMSWRVLLCVWKGGNKVKVPKLYTLVSPSTCTYSPLLLGVSTKLVKEIGWYSSGLLGIISNLTKGDWISSNLISPLILT